MDQPAGPGARAAPQWRRPLIAAAITLVLAVALLAFGYARMTDQADDAASAIKAGHGVTRAASEKPGASGKGKQGPGAPAGAASSP
jgi:hypothetical protein